MKLYHRLPSDAAFLDFSTLDRRLIDQIDVVLAITLELVVVLLYYSSSYQRIVKLNVTER